MEQILVIRNIDLLSQQKNRTVVVETDDIDKIEFIKNAVKANNHLFCIKLHVDQAITSIQFNEEWQRIPLVVYPAGLGAVRDLVGMLPLLKKLNVKFFFNGAVAQHYEAAQILSSLGIYSGIVINENADWEKLTDLMYYALCGKVAHAPIEPFQFVYDMYERNRLVNYGVAFFEDEENFLHERDDFFSTESAEIQRKHRKFFYEATDCGACAGWRICLGKYATLEDKSGCRSFTAEWLQVMDGLKFKV